MIESMPVLVSAWYENPLFLAPVFGFLGVIVGGLITAGSSYLLEKQREDRERWREDRIRTVNIKTAARLIELDFRFANTYVKLTVQNKGWPTILKEPPSFQNWEKYCAFLAPELSQQDWIALVVAARSGVHIKNRFERDQLRGNIVMSDEEVAHLAKVFLEPINEGRRVLLRLTGGTTIEAQMKSPEGSPETDWII